ncbi:hypothetical protein PV-S19_0074 [Pacmanvirus S19]|nr:hypothetical protein PV-S19_0074 [Pacmanvirus S19]
MECVKNIYQGEKIKNLKSNLRKNLAQSEKIIYKD